MSTLAILISDVDRTPQVRIEGISISWRLGGRGESSFETYSSDGSYIPELGHDVVWFNSSGTRIWGGVVTNIKPTALYKSTDPGVPVVTKVHAATYEQLLDRRMVTVAVYDGKTCKEIITDIFDNKLPEGGHFDLHQWGSTVQAGATIDWYVIDHVRVSDILDDLAERSGYTWWVGNHRDLYFVPRATSPGTYFAPFSITDAAPNCRELSIEQSLEGYRNRQHIRISYAAGDVSTQTIVGDGVTKQWTLNDYNASPVVSSQINYIESITITSGSPASSRDASWGTDGVDTDKEFYFLMGGTYIRQDAAEAALTADQQLTVNWRQLGNDVLTVGDGLEVAIRSAVESGVWGDSTGIYENMIDNSTEIDSVGHLAKAQAVLDAKSTIGTIVEGVTDEEGLFPGQVLDVAISTPPFTGSVLIDSVEAEYLRQDMLRYRFHASTTAYEDWITLWNKVLSPGSGMSSSGGVSVIGGAASGSGAFCLVIDGAGTIPIAEFKGYLQAPYDCTITGWTMMGNVSGSAQITVKKCVYADLPTTASIVSSAPPKLTSQQYATSTDVSTWTTAVRVGDVLEFTLDSISTITWLILQLQVTKA